MSMFKSYQKFSAVEVFDDFGAAAGTKRVEVPRWSTEVTVNWLRSHGMSLVKVAVRDGWHVSLIDFVQHQHRLPNPHECEDLWIDFQKIETATKHSPKRGEMLKTRERIKAALVGEIHEAAE